MLDWLRIDGPPEVRLRRPDGPAEFWRRAWVKRRSGAATTGEDSGAALRRIKADPKAREAVRKRLKFGMSIVTTDRPADATARSADGFVVLDSAS